MFDETENPDEGTVDRKQRFLHVLVETGGNVTAACKSVRVGRATAYRWRHADEQFARNWDLAFDLSTQALEDEAVRRATIGTNRPQFYQGRIVGHFREKSDLLLMFVLKARKPDMYRDPAKGIPSNAQLRATSSFAHQPPTPLIDTLAEAERSAKRLLGYNLVVSEVPGDAPKPASSPAPIDGTASPEPGSSPPASER